MSVPTEQLQNTPAPKTQRTLWKSGWKDSNSQRNGGVGCGYVSPKNVRSYTYKFS